MSAGKDVSVPYLISRTISIAEERKRNTVLLWSFWHILYITGEMTLTTHRTHRTCFNVEAAWHCEGSNKISHWF